MDCFYVFLNLERILFLNLLFHLILQSLKSARLQRRSFYIFERGLSPADHHILNIYYQWNLIKLTTISLLLIGTTLWLFSIFLDIITSKCLVVLDIGFAALFSNNFVFLLLCLSCICVLIWFSISSAIFILITLYF